MVEKIKALKGTISQDYWPAYDAALTEAENTVTISQERYNELLKSEDILQKLKDAGVDNWDGYDCLVIDGDESYEDIYGDE